MFKAFTGSENKASGKTSATDGSAPRTLLRASKLMVFGAGATIVYGVFWAIVALVNKNAWLKSYETVEHESAKAASSGFYASVVFTLVLSVAAAALWWWMSRLNAAGLWWARLASSVLFLLWTYFTYESISGANSVVGLLNLIVELTIWGIGGVAMYHLWLPESSLFIRSTKAANSR
jgi:glucan phosphoethanolaminetransferase (alkaline phosphatase superfamily)